MFLHDNPTAEIKTLVIKDKWLASLGVSVQSEIDCVSQTLSGRIKELAERYATLLPILVEQAEVLRIKVQGHLKKMGFEV